MALDVNNSGGSNDSPQTGHQSLFASQFSTIIFSSWKTNTWQEMFGSCLAICIIAVTAEGLKSLEAFLLAHIPVRLNGNCGRQCWNLNVTPLHFVITLLHMLQTFIGFCLMLVFMTYNVWLCLAVVFGAGIGYFIFKLLLRKRTVDESDSKMSLDVFDGNNEYKACS